MTYEQYLSWRDEPETVVLNAFQLEPLFYIVPDQMAAEGKGLTQQELDQILAGLIPSKETRILLYCEENFYPTRRMAAKTSVGISLIRNGYQNVYELETLWDKKTFFGNEKYSSSELEDILKNEVLPYIANLSVESTPQNDYFKTLLEAYRQKFLTETGAK